jgi:DNA-binding MarR family transcriptional regulator
MSSDDSRDELVEAVLRDSRRSSAQAALFSQAVADRLGLAGSDIECLDILAQEGRLTVGRLAELTGLTTGSATRMIDRLEQAGYVRRVPDPTDRRRVLVEPIPERTRSVGALHDSLRSAARELIAGVSDAELRVIARYLERSIELTRAEAARLREPAGVDEPSTGSFAAPVGAVTSGRLVFVSGAPRIAVRGDASLQELCRANFEGPVPRMRVRDGVVTVSYPRLGWFDWRTQWGGQAVNVSAHWRKDRGEIALNPIVPWAIELRGGVSRLSVDARALRLESFNLHGGASQVDLTLPVPAGVVRIRIEGGMNNIEVERPAGVAIVLELRGGVNQAIVDGEMHKARGRLSLQTPGADGTPDRYEIDLSGGVSKVVVTTR